VEAQVVVTVIYSREPLDGTVVIREALECYTGVIKELVGGTTIVCWESHNVVPPQNDGTGAKASMFLVTIYHDPACDAEGTLSDALETYLDDGLVPEGITQWDIQEAVPLLTLPPKDRPPLTAVVKIGGDKGDEIEF